jgi:hypothetical protein
MALPLYTIAFSFPLADGAVKVLLTAQVEKRPHELFYLVKHFRTHPSQQDSLLPDLIIRKVNGLWVHEESGKESVLSSAIGAAIDEQENQPRDIWPRYSDGSQSP